MWKQKLVLLILSASLSLFAEKSYYSDANRSLYNSPHSRALGGADMALSYEGLPSASPAGIIRNERSLIYVGYAGFYQNLFGATTVAMTRPVDSIQSVGVSLSYLMIPGVEFNTASENMSGTPKDISLGSETSSELYLNVLYGRKFLTFSKGYLSAGAAIHLKRQRLIEWTGYGIGADLGFLSQFNNGIALALKVENFLTEYTHWSKNYSENGLPRFYFGFGFERTLTAKLDFSVSYRTPDLFGNSGVGGGSFSTDGQFEGEPERLSVRSNPGILFTYANYGGEFVINKTVSLRAGFTDTRMLNFGGGVHLFNRWDIDFVYSHSNALSGTYSIATKMAF